MAVKITSRNELWIWLEDKPADWVTVVASRAALRGFPITVDPRLWSGGMTDPKLVMSTLRALVLSFHLEAWPVEVQNLSNNLLGVEQHKNYDRDTAIRQATNAKATEATRSAALAAISATRCVGSSRSAYVAASVAEEVANIRATADRAFGDTGPIWKAVECECELLESGQGVSELLTSSIWPDEPIWWKESWDAARKWLSGFGSGFELWREWYHGRVEGLPNAFGDFDEAANRTFYSWIREKDEIWWSREPADVNGEIIAVYPLYIRNRLWHIMRHDNEASHHRSIFPQVS